MKTFSAVIHPIGVANTPKVAKIKTVKLAATGSVLKISVQGKTSSHENLLTITGWSDMMWLNK